MKTFFLGLLGAVILVTAYIVYTISLDVRAIRELLTPVQPAFRTGVSVRALPPEILTF